MATPSTFTGAVVAVGDLNGNGVLDLVVNNAGQSQIYLNDPMRPGSFATTISLNRAPNSVSSVAVGDFNGDGRRDLVVANQFSANISVLLGNGNGTFQSAVNYFVGQGPVSVAVGNLGRFLRKPRSE